MIHGLSSIVQRCEKIIFSVEIRAENRQKRGKEDDKRNKPSINKSERKEAQIYLFVWKITYL
jgi:hypothetical protein